MGAPNRLANHKLSVGMDHIRRVITYAVHIAAGRKQVLGGSDVRLGGNGKTQGRNNR